MTQKGSVDFVIKCYPKSGDYAGGVMSRFLESKKVGDKLLMKGPVGYITYKGGNIMQILYPEGKDPIRITKLAYLQVARVSHLTSTLWMLSTGPVRAASKSRCCTLIRHWKTSFCARNLTLSTPTSLVPTLLLLSLTREQGTVPAGIHKGRVTIEMLR